VVSLYEAGRDGFWIHRWLVSVGVENVIVDSSSIEVSRRQRRAKTDRLDAEKLLSLLIRRELGEHKALRALQILSPDEEDSRHLHRALQTLKKERTRLAKRVRSFLFAQGVRMGVCDGLEEQLDEVRLWDGSQLGPSLRRRILLEWQRWRVVRDQIRELEKERRAALKAPSTLSEEKAQRLLMLRGVGGNGAWLLGHELFGPREFRNRREVGSYCGLCPTPHSSGEDDRERGISKSGNRRVRSIAVELAWGWLRFQPESELAKWYEKRFGSGSARHRKVGIVALARKLVIALWRFVEQGVLPDGCELKPDVSAGL
jgi:transposase